MSKKSSKNTEADVCSTCGVQLSGADKADKAAHEAAHPAPSKEQDGADEDKSASESENA